MTRLKISTNNAKFQSVKLLKFDLLNYIIKNLRLNLSIKSESLKVVAIPATVPFIIFCKQANLILNLIGETRNGQLTFSEPEG